MAQQTQQVLQQAQAAAQAIANSATTSVASNQFIFFAAFDGTDNEYVPVDGDPQNTAIAQLYDQVSGNQTDGGTFVAKYYSGLGTPGTLPASDWFPPAVTAQSITTAQQAYNDFAQAAFMWLKANPGGSVTSMIAGFSRGCAAEAIFAQMLYENGLVFNGQVLIPPGTIGAVSAALAIDPVLTGESGNMDFPPGVQNLTVVRAENEYRSEFTAADYGVDNDTIIDVPGDHSDAGDAYDNGLGGIYLGAYTSFFQKAGLNILPVISTRQFISETATPIVIHSEVALFPPYEISLYNQTNDLSVTREITTYGTPVAIVKNASIFTSYNGDIVIGGHGYTIDTGSVSAPIWVLLPETSAFATGLSATTTISLTQNDTLDLSSGLNIDSTTFVFPAANTIDVPGILVTSGSFSADDVLTLIGSLSSVSLELDPNATYYSEESFFFEPDGTGGTDVISEDDRKPLDFSNANETFLVVDPADVTGSISGFTPGDTIDLVGIVATGGTLSGSRLSVQESGGGVASLNFSSAVSYRNDAFLLAPDGLGGTDITVGAGTQSIAFTGSNEILLIDSPLAFKGTISNFQVGDTIDLAGLPATTGYLYDNNTLSATSVSSFTTLTLDPHQDFQGYEPVFASDGNGGGDITLKQLPPPYTYVFNYTGNAFVPDPEQLVNPGKTEFPFLAGSVNASFTFSHMPNYYSGNISYQGNVAPLSYPDETIDDITPYLSDWSVSAYGITVTGDGLSDNKSGILSGDFVFQNGVMSQWYFTASDTLSGKNFSASSYEFAPTGVYLPQPIDDAGISTGPRSLGQGQTTVLGSWSSEELPCFLASTGIATTRGEITVEQLAIGDQALTHSGVAQRVKWLGHRSMDCGKHPKPADVWPVRICADAFGPGLPGRDLFLSPEHAVFAEGVLIPVKHLINGATIVQEPRDTVTYWHVELERHDVILAEGLPCESWLDTGNRAMFANGSVIDLHPSFARTAAQAWAQDACAPLVEDGPALVAVRQALADRANALGLAVTQTPEIEIAEPGQMTLSVAADAEIIRLVSRSDRRGDDRRRLGALVRALRIDGEPLALHDARLGAGFHEVEVHGIQTVRWTNGNATVHLGCGSATRRIEVDVASVMTERVA
jgi:hypothetical protein